MEQIDEIVEEAVNIGVPYLTLYAFSKENWTRPKDEVDFLVNHLLSHYLDLKLTKLKTNRIRFNAIGNMADLSEEVRRKIERNRRETSGFDRLVLTLALSYSGREEIAAACRKLAERVKAGEFRPEEIDEAMIERTLYTAGLPDPDLLIRTSGELRVSNFLLWQISYAEIYVTETMWPDFTPEEFRRAIEDFQKRERRFGLVECPPSR
jgi:undecaprenyl diphosphate synthase